MHPGDLASCGLRGGQRVRVSSRVGMVEVEVISLPHGWGHGRPNVQLEIARDQPGESANDLTDERLMDAVSGNAALNGGAADSRCGMTPGHIDRID